MTRVKKLEESKVGHKKLLGIINGEIERLQERINPLLDLRNETLNELKEIDEEIERSKLLQKYFFDQ